MEQALAVVVKAFGNTFAECEQWECTRISHKVLDRLSDCLARELCEIYRVPLGFRCILVKCEEIGGVELSK